MSALSLAVIGDPIAHSRSPLMHAAAFRTLGISTADYRAIRVAAEDLAGFVTRDAAAAGLSGFNVTVPHKTRIVALLDEVDPEAVQVGAVNTVYRTARGWGGCNTDVEGFSLAFDALIGGLPEAGEAPHVVVLGGGGAARAVVAALCQRPATTSITWVTRDPARLRAGGWPHPEAAHKVRVIGWGAWDARCGGSVVVQATPVGLAGTQATFPIPISSVALGQAQAVFDLVVPAGPDSLFRAAQEANVAACDGHEMLVGQGFCALERWLGGELLAATKPDVLAAMRGALREETARAEPQKGG